MLPSPSSSDPTQPHRSADNSLSSAKSVEGASRPSVAGATGEHPAHGEQPVHEVQTSHVLNRLTVLSPTVAVLYSYLGPGWTVLDILEGLEPVRQLYAQANLGPETTVHSVILFAKGVQLHKLSANFSSTMRHTIIQNKLVANGIYFPINTPFIYETLLRAITLGKSGQFSLVSSRNRESLADGIAHQLEASMTHPAFTATVKVLGAKGGGRMQIEDLVHELEAMTKANHDATS